VAFAICWAPIQIILVLKSLRLYDTTTLTVSIQIISHVLAYLNSCLNPFLYAFLSENFRKAFRKVMWCGPVSSQYILAAPDTKSTRTRHTGNGAASVDIL
jgi:allatostatin A receptor